MRSYEKTSFRILRRGPGHQQTLFCVAFYHTMFTKVWKVFTWQIFFFMALWNLSCSPRNSFLGSLALILMLSTNQILKSLALIETLPALSDYYQHLAGGRVWMSWTLLSLVCINNWCYDRLTAKVFLSWLIRFLLFFQIKSVWAVSMVTCESTTLVPSKQTMAGQASCLKMSCVRPTWDNPLCRSNVGSLSRKYPSLGWWRIKNVACHCRLYIWTDWCKTVVIYSGKDTTVSHQAINIFRG